MDWVLNTIDDGMCEGKKEGAQIFKDIAGLELFEESRTAKHVLLRYNEYAAWTHAQRPPFKSWMGLAMDRRSDRRMVAPQKPTQKHLPSDISFALHTAMDSDRFDKEKDIPKLAEKYKEHLGDHPEARLQEFCRNRSKGTCVLQAAPAHVHLHHPLPGAGTKSSNGQV